MVLQQGTPVRIWGSAATGEQVTVALAGQQAAGTTDAQGRWQVQLAPLAAGGPHVMTVTGANVVTVTNILVGEVWVAAGQSNMQMALNAVNRPDEIASADWPQIRAFNVARDADIVPREDAAGAWQTCSPKTVGDFSAAAYFFARELHRHLNVPVGIILSAWGGTAAEAWISRDGLQTEPVLQQAWEAFDRDSRLAAQAPKELKVDDGAWMNPDFDDHTWKSITLPLYWDYVLYPIEYNGVIWARRSVDIPDAWAGKRLRLELTVDDFEITYFEGQEIGRTSQHTLQLRSYEIPAERVRAGQASIAIQSTKIGWGGIMGGKEKLRLSLADDPAQFLALAGEWKYAPAQLIWTSLSPRLPASLYNAMIAPLTPFTIRGTIWYQGEANAWQPSAFAYRKILPALIGDWRRLWEQGDFPFYFVQLPNFMAPSDDPNANSAWAVLRESQLETLAVTNTGMAVAIDLGEANDIHPKNKWDVGRRLALAALDQTYAKPVAGRSPLPERVTFDGRQVRVRFSHAAQGLTTRDDGPVKGFALAGADGKFAWATAVIAGDSVLIENDTIATPASIRYAWADNPVGNLTGRNGLPASPFQAIKPTRSNAP
jgi:sialate O-acetylesterase